MMWKMAITILTVRSMKLWFQGFHGQLTLIIKMAKFPLLIQICSKPKTILLKLNFSLKVATEQFLSLQTLRIKILTLSSSLNSSIKTQHSAMNLRKQVKLASKCLPTQFRKFHKVKFCLNR